VAASDFPVTGEECYRNQKFESMFWRADDVKNTSFPDVTLVEDVECSGHPSTTRTD
jgi:expansin (peptidoglycan-binding protein)